jgi:competence protein ComEC
MQTALLGFIEAERGRFFLLVPVAMGAAILFYFALPVEPGLGLGITFVVAGVITLAASWRHPVARFAASLALAGGLGFGRAEWRTRAAPPLLSVPTSPTAVTGTVLDLQALPNGRRLTIGAPSLDGGPARRRHVVIRVRANDGATVQPGDTIATYALLFPPDRPAYPGGFAPDR